MSRGEAYESKIKPIIEQLIEACEEAEINLAFVLDLDGNDVSVGSCPFGDQSDCSAPFYILSEVMQDEELSGEVMEFIDSKLDDMGTPNATIH